MAIDKIKDSITKSVAQDAIENTQRIVREMLESIQEGGEQKALEFAKELDNWSGDVVLSEQDIAQAGESLSDELKNDIQFAYSRVKAFAEHQLASLSEFETELAPGVVAGQRLIPISTAGCYVPGGRYAHVASCNYEHHHCENCGSEKCDRLLTTETRCRSQSGDCIYRIPLRSRLNSRIGWCSGYSSVGLWAVYWP